MYGLRGLTAQGREEVADGSETRQGSSWIGREGSEGQEVTALNVAHISFHPCSAFLTPLFPS